MLKGPKHLRKLYQRTVIIFFHHSEKKWFGKYLPYWNLKSQGYLLTHCLPMASILFGIVRCRCSVFKGKYLKNEKLILDVLFYFWNLHQILNIFKKKKIVIANVFPKLQTLKYLVRPLSKKLRLRTSFESQHVKGLQTLVKSAWERFYRIFSSLWEKIIWKIFPLVKFELSGVFVNTLTADDKYPVWDSENLLFLIERIS